MLNIFNATNMYITSDNHFFHSNIIKYCDRNYNWESDEDILRMNEDMLKEFDKLADSLHVPLPKGAGAQVDVIGQEIVEKYGRDKLKEIAKFNFKNTDRILHTLVM